jgi:hypothetical protein
MAASVISPINHNEPASKGNISRLSGSPLKITAEEAFMLTLSPNTQPPGNSAVAPKVQMEGAQIALLAEVAPGVAALLPAERAGKNVVPVLDKDAILTGSCEPGGQLWTVLRKEGWRWVQDSSFGPKYWRRDQTRQSH